MNAALAYHYNVYGLTVASEIELPQLLPVVPKFSGTSLDCDVRICFGRVFEAFPNHDKSDDWAQALNGECLLKIKGAGRFLISRGVSVVVDKEKNVSLDDLRTWLLGSVLAAVAHQRRLVPLHISAVLSPDGAIAFTGDSGAGKSTTAAYINQILDWPLISDDVSALYVSPNGYEIESGVHTIKLWEDALQSLDRSSEGLKRDLLRMNKFHAIDAEKFVSGRFPLKKLIDLRWGEVQKLERLTGRNALPVGLSSIYRPELAQVCGNTVAIQTAIALANGVDIFQLTRRKHDCTKTGVSESVSLLLDNLAF